MVKELCLYEDVRFILESKNNFKDLKSQPIHSTKRYTNDDIIYNNPVQYKKQGR